MPEDGLKLKLLLSDQPELVRLIEGAERGEAELTSVPQSVGFHDDPEVHRQVVEYLQSLGCKTLLVPDGKPDRGLAGIRQEKNG